MINGSVIQDSVNKDHRLNLWQEILERRKIIESLEKEGEGELNVPLHVGIEMGYDYRIIGSNGTTELHRFIQSLMHYDRRNIYTLYFYCFRKKSREKMRKIFPILPDNFKLRFINFPSFLAFRPILKRFYEFFMYEVLIPSIVKRDLIDVFVSTYPATPCFEQVKCVKLIHDLYDYIERESYLYGREEDVLRRFFLNEDTEYADIIFTFSEKEKGFLKEWASAKRKNVISLGADFIDTPKHVLYNSSELLKRYKINSPFILLVGSIGTEQQARIALRALDESRERLGQLYQVVLISENGFVQNNFNLNEPMIKKNGKDILSISVLNLVELLCVIAASKLMIYLGDTKDGLWLLWEVVKMRIPTIASAWPPPPPILENCLAWVQPGDHLILSERIIELTTDEMTREKLIKSCDKMFETVQWRQAVVEFVNVLCRRKARE